jgi:hypothetical protein
MSNFPQALIDELSNLEFHSVGEAAVVFCLLFQAGASAASLQALPGFKEGAKSLLRRGALTIQDGDMHLHFAAFAPKEDEE